MTTKTWQKAFVVRSNVISVRLNEKPFLHLMRLAAKQSKIVDVSTQRQQDMTVSAEDDSILQQTRLSAVASGEIQPSSNLGIIEEIPGSLFYEILGFLDPDSIDIMNL
ncbi:13264_t:CDS:1, partial [Acaulospora morrowiae]